MKKENITFGEKLRTLRISHAKTQQEVADDLCISRTTLSNYETGSRTPDISTFTMLADYFGVDANFFVDTAKICAVLKENDNHTICIMKEKESVCSRKKMSPSSLIALNHFRLNNKTSKIGEKNERK